MGYAAVALLALTGAINSLLLVGSLGAMFGTPYGRLLAFKILLFLARVVVALINRFHFAPRVSDEPGALQRWAIPSPSSKAWGSRCLQR
jgi:putative copper resistance protein D